MKNSTYKVSILITYNNRNNNTNNNTNRQKRQQQPAGTFATDESMKSTEVEFLEDRIIVLDGWLENAGEDEDNEDYQALVQKRKEYEALSDEIVLLQKKLRKISKLNTKEKDEKVLQKFERKQNQYSTEIEEIMNYVEMDELFETAEIEPNELLGEPLETLTEQPGMEGSCSGDFDFSISDFMPKRKTTSTVQDQQQQQRVVSSYDDDVDDHSQSSPDIITTKEDYEKVSSHSAGIMNGLFTISVADSNTNNYDESILNKKLKKVNRLLRAHNDDEASYRFRPIEVRKLMKKRKQYTEALRNQISSSNTKLVSSTKNNFTNYDESTLKKKLKKVNKLLKRYDQERDDNSLTPDEVKKLIGKQEQYTQALLNITGNRNSPIPNNNNNTEEYENNNNNNNNNILEFSGGDIDKAVDFVEEEYEEEILPSYDDDNEEYEEQILSSYDHDDNEEENVANHCDHSLYSNAISNTVDNANHHADAASTHDQKTLKKKLKKLKKLISSTDDIDDIEMYKQKKKEYKMALEILKEKENKDKRQQQQQHDDSDDDNEFVRSKDNNEEDDIEDPLSLQQQQQTDEKEYQERVKLLKRKINKADKSIKKDDDPKKIKKMEGKRKEYQAELDELLTKTKS